MNDREPSRIIRVSIAAILRPSSEPDAQTPCVLAAWRPIDAVRGGVWELPGGKIDDGETAAEAAQREVREELQIEIVPRESLGGAEDIDETQTKERHVHVEVVLADLKGDEPRDSDRLWQWIPIARLHEFEWPRANAELNRLLQARFGVEQES
ncbi:MAG: NUDIX domain-containing protein [Planctomycetota bacterium]|jgi:8-oxo-dGTP diphosphatase|nr:NUDIX domain-containing protein [Planctomycetota bacterium]MDA1025849.1 NUDIX domain-containing protein [Planctomycetota bacterium]